MYNQPIDGGGEEAGSCRKPVQKEDAASLEPAGNPGVRRCLMGIGKGLASRSGPEAEGVFCFFILLAADDSHPGHP